MNDCLVLADIRPPESAQDARGALRVFEDFLTQYQPVLSAAESYFDHVLQEVPPHFSEAYRPWQEAARDLLQGITLISRRVPLRDTRRFADALRLFSLESVARMMKDVCTACSIRVPPRWVESFLRNIRALSEAFLILYRQRLNGAGLLR